MSSAYPALVASEGLVSVCSTVMQTFLLELPPRSTAQAIAQLKVYINSIQYVCPLAVLNTASDVYTLNTSLIVRRTSIKQDIHLNLSDATTSDRVVSVTTGHHATPSRRQRGRTFFECH
jgi:hypothetical protein